MTSIKPNLKRMEKIVKLTVDQKGMLHGGFALQAALPQPDGPNTTNKNCNMKGEDVVNQNCICEGCFKLSTENDGCFNFKCL